MMKSTFSTDNGTESFSSEIDGMGLHIGYSVNHLYKRSRISPLLTFGVQRLSYKTNDLDRESAIAIPFGIGIRINVYKFH